MKEFQKNFMNILKHLSLPPYKALCFTAALTTLKLEEEGPFRGDIEDADVMSREFELKELSN